MSPPKRPTHSKEHGTALQLQIDHEAQRAARNPTQALPTPPQHAGTGATAPAQREQSP